MRILIPYVSEFLPAYLISEIAKSLGVRAEIEHKGRPKIRKAASGVTGIPHHDFRVRLYPVTDTLRSLTLSWQGDRPRRNNAVCWHGHRDFMRKLFDAFPMMTIRTALAEYNGEEDFENTHERTSDQQWNRNRVCKCPIEEWS